MFASVLGIPDPWIWTAYVLCLAAAALCVVHALLRGGERDADPAADAVPGAIREEREQGG